MTYLLLASIMTQSAVEMPVSGQKKLEKNIFLLPPLLAAEIGASAATVLQQIHYWVQNPKCGSIIDGVRWIYNTYKQWQEQLKYLSESTIKRAIARLKALNLIKVEKHDKSQWNHRNYYTVNYESLKALQFSIGSNCTEQSSQIEPSTQTNLHQSSIPDITPEDTSNKTTTQPVVALSNESVSQEPVQPYPVSPELPVKQVKAQPATIDHSPIISEERINEVKALGVKVIIPALRKEVARAEPEVFEDAIAVVKEAKSKDKVNSPGAYLLDAIRGRWKLPDAAIAQERKAVFKEWFDAAYKRGEVLFSRSDRGCIEVSNDKKAENWTEWEENL